MTTFDLAALRRHRCVAIVRGETTEHFARTAQTLVNGGLPVLEFPLTTPGALSSLGDVIGQLKGDAWVGIGTVTNLDQAKAAYEAGAAFIVTPSLDLAVLAFARSVGLPVIAGALSPTEVHSAYSAGATAVKLYPASLGGPDYIRDLRTPFPDIPLVPTGGVEMDVVSNFLGQGAVAVGMGGALLGSAANGGSQEDLRTRIHRFRSAAGLIPSPAIANA